MKKFALLVVVFAFLNTVSVVAMENTPGPFTGFFGFLKSRFFTPTASRVAPKAPTYQEPLDKDALLRHLYDNRDSKPDLANCWITGTGLRGVVECYNGRPSSDAFVVDTALVDMGLVINLCGLSLASFIREAICNRRNPAKKCSIVTLNPPCVAARLGKMPSAVVDYESAKDLIDCQQELAQGKYQKIDAALKTILSLDGQQWLLHRGKNVLVVGTSDIPTAEAACVQLALLPQDAAGSAEVVSAVGEVV